MGDSMSHRERVMATLKGEAVDRAPVSMWRHFYDREDSIGGLVEAMLGFQRRYDWDFMKLNPRAQYHAEDWGVVYAYSDDPFVAPRLTSAPVKRPEDWERIGVLDVRSPVLGGHLEAVAQITRQLEGEVPVLMTVFTPLSIASRLVDSDVTMLAHLRERPAQVHGALQSIAETFAAFAKECIAAGADGIFFATTSWASRLLLTEEEYLEFGRPYDLRVLAATQAAPFNVLHVCRGENMLRLLRDYPVQAFNWDARDATNPGLEEGLELTDGAIIGGIDQRRLDGMSLEEAATQAKASLIQGGDRRFMLGAGCTISPRTSPDLLDALRAEVGR